MRKATCDYPWNESVKTDSFYEMICLAEKEVPDRAVFKYRQGKDNIIEVSNKELRKSVDAMYLALEMIGAAGVTHYCYRSFKLQMVTYIHFSTLF